MSVEKLVKRATKAREVANQWRGLYEQAYEYALPMRNTFSGTRRGQSNMERIYDSTAINSTQKFASKLQTSLTPPFQHWLEFQPGIEIPEDQREEALRLLEGVSNKFFGIINNSNFNTAITEYFTELAVGTAAMLVMEGDDENPVTFTTVPVSQIALDEGPHGSVDGVFRFFSMAARNVEPTWPDINSTGRGVISNLVAGESEHEDKVNLIEATYFDRKANKYQYNVVLLGHNDDSSAQIIVDRQMETNPWVVTRWSKVSGEVFGRGPLLYALPDIKTLNKVRELLLQNASMAINGLWQATSNSSANLNTVSIKPGTFIPVERIGDIQRLDIPGDIRLGEEMSQALQVNIRQALFDKGLPSETAAVRSATEIIERQKEVSQEIGAPFSRIISELLKPLSGRLLAIMEKKNLLDFPIKVDGKSVKIEATSPLSQNQKLEEISNLAQLIEMSNQLGPEVVAGSLKVEKIPAYMAEQLGVSPDLIRSEEEQEELQEQAGQAMAQQQQAQPQPGMEGPIEQQGA